LHVGDDVEGQLVRKTMKVVEKSVSSSGLTVFVVTTAVRSTELNHSANNEALSLLIYSAIESFSHSAIFDIVYFQLLGIFRLVCFVVAFWLQVIHFLLVFPFVVILLINTLLFACVLS